MADHEKIEKMVEKATSDYLIQPDWDTNLQIIDTINQDPRKTQDVLKVIQKRLKNSKSRIQFYAIELLEAIVKNCPSSHVIVGSKDFQDDLLKLATKKLKDNLKEKLLDAIQYWADSFQRRGDLQGFSRSYMELKRQNVVFPPRRKEPLLTFTAPTPAAVPVVPVVVPSYNPYPGYAAAQVPYTDTSPIPNTPQIPQSPPNNTGTITVINPEKKEQVVQSVSVLSEMLSFISIDDPTQDPATDEVIQDMLNICRSALPQVRSLLENGQVSDSMLAGMITLNDDLTRTILNYDELVVRKKAYKEGWRPEPTRATTTTTTTTTQSRPTQPQYNHAPSNKPPTNDLLGDLSTLFTNTSIDPIGSNPGVTVASPSYNPFGTSTSPPNNALANPNNTNTFDEFDLLATRHSSISPTSSLTGGTSLLPPPTSSNSLYGSGSNTGGFPPTSLYPTASSYPNSNTSSYGLAPTTTYPNSNTSSYGSGSGSGSSYAAPPPYSSGVNVNSYNAISTYPSISQPQPIGSTGYPPASNPSLYPANVHYPSAPSTLPTYNNSNTAPLSYANYSSPPSNTYNYNPNYPPK